MATSVEVENGMSRCKYQSNVNSHRRYYCGCRRRRRHTVPPGSLNGGDKQSSIHSLNSPLAELVVRCSCLLRDTYDHERYTSNKLQRTMATLRRPESKDYGIHEVRLLL